jgi:hypothetical protein
MQAICRYFRENPKVAGASSSTGHVEKREQDAPHYFNFTKITQQDHSINKSINKARDWQITLDISA